MMRGKPGLFEISLSEYVDSLRAKAGAEVAHISCERLRAKGPDGMLQELLPQFQIAVPSIDAEPTHKDLRDNGQRAVYVHTVAAPNSFRLAPQSSHFGGYPYELAFASSSITISMPATENPPAKQRHAQIIQNLSSDIAGLAREITLNNSSLASYLPQLLAERQRQCDDIDRRRADL